MINESDFRAEVGYRTVMNIADRMLETGLITGEERGIIDTKYRPVLGMLLSGKPLI